MLNARASEEKTETGHKEGRGDKINKKNIDKIKYFPALQALADSQF